MENELKTPSEQNPTFGPIVEKTKVELDKDKNKNDWRKQYITYGEPVVKKLESYKKMGNRIKRVLNYYVEKAVGGPIADLQLYTSLSRAKQAITYDLRFRGQHVSDIDFNEKERPQLHPYKIKSSEKWRDLEPSFSKAVEIRSQEAGDYFRKVAKYDGKTKSPEHRLESLVLRMFAETRGDYKIPQLRNIQPVKLGGCFFQLPTKLSASKIKGSTHEIKMSEGAGGGIDILARISKPGVGFRLAVIELKDENKPSEDVELALVQAMAYATLVAYLLDDKKLGETWYNIFRGETKKENFVPVPDNIEILVMAMMPRKKDGSKEKDVNETPIELKLKNKTIRFIPCTCYLDFDKSLVISPESSYLKHKK